MFLGTPLRDNFLRSKVAGGRPRRLRDDFVMMFDGFLPASGAQNGAFMFIFLCVFLAPLKKEQKNYKSS